MKRLKSIEEIREAIKQEAALLYISSPACNVCKVLKPKIEELFSQAFPKVALYEADISEVPQMSAEFSILSAPVVLLFFDGREFVREGRNVSLDLFQERVEKVYRLYFG